LRWTLVPGAAEPSVAQTLIEVIEKTGGATAFGAMAHKAIGVSSPLPRQLRANR
jgi:hypothetical protein